MKIKQTFAALLLMLGITTFCLAPVVAAGTCGGVSTSIISCDQNDNTKPETSGIWGILLLVINILTIGVGVAAMGGIVYGAVLYTSSGGDIEKTKRAKVIIYNTVLGIAAYAVAFAFLNYIIPGGIFG